MAAGSEAWIWAGDPPGSIQGDLAFEFEMEFLAAPADGVGRHAGIFFFASAPTQRWEISGYDVWWIDRGQDFGISIRRWDAGVLTFLTPGTFGAVSDPPLLWRVEVDGPAIRVFGDGVLYAEAHDDRYRIGRFGFWAYSNGQDVRFDNLRIGRGGDLPSCSPAGVAFIRGDSNASGTVDLADPIHSLNYQFAGGPPIPPPNVCGVVEGADCEAFAPCRPPE